VDHALSHKEPIMGLLKWALLFLVMACVAALFGFTDIAQGSAEIARVLFTIFLVVFAILGLMAYTGYKAVT